MSSEHLASAKDHLKGDLGGSWNILDGASGQYFAPQLARRFGVAEAAFSLRDIGANGTRVVEVRRDNDDVAEDFSAEQITNGTLAAFVGSGNNGFVAKWYDQSGNGNHAEQATTGKQPKIVDSSSGYLGHIRFPGGDELDITNVLMDGANAVLYLVGKADLSVTQRCFFSTRGTGGGGLNLLYTAAENPKSGFTGVGNNTSTNITVSGSDKVIVFEKAGTSMNQYIDNVAGNDNGVLGTYSSPSGTVKSRIGSQAHSSGSDTLIANINEIVIYNSDIASDRSTIQLELAEHYGITLS